MPDFPYDGLLGRRQPAAHDEIFVLDLVRQDGSRFVTAAGTNAGVREARMRHKAVTGRVAHWRRCGDDPTGYRHPMDRWELQERYDL